MELQAQIRKVCQRWKWRQDKPPFSPAELITMALVATNSSRWEINILDWIDRNFSYYSGVSDVKSWNARSIMHDHDRDVATLKEYLITGFREFELPANRCLMFESETLELAWRVSIPDARLYLQVPLGLNKGTFAFLQLPAELRNTIYEMVMHYPPSGIYPAVNAGSEASTFRPISKDSRYHGEPVPLDSLSYLKDSAAHFYYIQSAQKALSLLLVNKQIYEEALPFFYRLNIFTFTSVTTMAGFLKKLPSSRQRYIRDLAFSYGPGEGKFAESAFQALASMENLSKLHVDIVESKWLHRQPDKKILRLPGLGTLRKIRVEEVVFSKHCPKVAALLKAELESSPAQKRKAGEMEDEGERQDSETEKAKRLRFC